MTVTPVSAGVAASDPPRVTAVDALRGFNDLTSRSRYLPEFYRGELAEFFRSKSLPFLKRNDVSTTSRVGGLAEKEFPGLPAFQDKNL